MAPTELSRRRFAAILAVAVAIVTVVGLFVALEGSYTLVVAAGTSIRLGAGQPFVRLEFPVEGSGGRLVGAWTADQRSLVVVTLATEHPDTWFRPCSCGWPSNGTLDLPLGPGSHAITFFAGSTPDTITIVRTFAVVAV